MKRSKKIGILCAVFVCISLAAFGVSRYEEQKERIRNSDEIILELAQEDVKILSWECDTGSFAFHREENGGWLYDTDEAFPVDNEKIGNLLDQFQAFGVSFIIEDVEDWGQYGLDEPVCTIHMETEEETYEILLGGYSAMDAERYVSIGDGNAYLVKKDPLNQFEVEISDLILHDEIPTLWDVTQIEFSGVESEKIIYEEGSANTYYPEDVYFIEQEDGYLPLDTSRVNEYLETIRNLSPGDYVTYNASGDELALYGLDTPELSISIDYKITEEETKEESAETFVLNIACVLAQKETGEKDRDINDEDAGKDIQEEGIAAEKSTKEEGVELEESAKEGDIEGEEITAYARVGASKIIYRISAEQYQKLMDMSYDSLRHKEMFWGDFSDMYQLDVTLEGINYSITSEMEDEKRIYYYQNEEVEMTDVRSAIRGLTAQTFTGEKPTQKEEISFTIYLDNDNYPQIRIELYRYDGDNCIAMVDKEPTAFVGRTEVVELIEAVNRIVLD